MGGLIIISFSAIRSKVREKWFKGEIAQKNPAYGEGQVQG